jgi:hypothetical protein
MDAHLSYAAAAAKYISELFPTFRSRPAGLSLHAGLTTLIATAIIDNQRGLTTKEILN